MDERMHEMARIMVANGYGFGKYWAGYIFAKSARDPFFLYLADKKMAVLFAGIDEDGEKEILISGDRLTPEELSSYFLLDFGKKSNIDWLEMTVNILLYTEKEPLVKNNIIYYMWPAVKLNFTSVLQPNTIVVYDRLASREKIDSLKREVRENRFSEEVEFWSMLKLLSMGDRFGELAPKVCMESIPKIKKEALPGVG